MYLAQEIMLFVFVCATLESVALTTPERLPIVTVGVGAFLLAYAKLDRLEAVLSEERRAEIRRFREFRREMWAVALVLTVLVCGGIFLLFRKGWMFPEAPGESVRLIMVPQVVEREIHTRSGEPAPFSTDGTPAPVPAVVPQPDPKGEELPR